MYMDYEGKINNTGKDVLTNTMENQSKEAKN
jgi:hypothetical protein